MQILIVNQTFHPDTAATAQHMWDLARHLDRHGHAVTIVSSRVYYGSNQLHERATDRYGSHITVERVAGTRFGKNSRAGLLGRALDFLSFYVAAAAKVRSLPTPDVVLALTSPPMISSLAAALRWVDGKLGRRVPRLVCHVMDLYPDAAVASGFLREGSLPHRLLASITARTLTSADAIIVLGRDMRERILGHCGGGRPVDSSRVHVVTPWAEGDQLRPLDKRQNPLARTLGLDDVFTVAYSGNLGIAHDLHTIARAIDLTRGDPLCWLFIGGGKRFDELRRLVEEKGWRHVRILPFQPREMLNESLNVADVHLVSQLPAFTGVVVPSKLFGILAVGRPAVMVGPTDAECARIIVEQDAGVVIENGDAAGLVAAVTRLRENTDLCRAMGERGRAAFEREYDSAISCGRIAEILRSVI